MVWTEEDPEFYNEGLEEIYDSDFYDDFDEEDSFLDEEEDSENFYLPPYSHGDFEEGDEF